MTQKEIATSAARRVAGLVGCLTVLAVVATAPGVFAAPIIVDSHGFETPFFTTTAGGTGSIEGQTPFTFNGTWLRAGSGPSTANVQTAVVAPGGGTQAVRVDKASGDNAFWAVPVSGYPASGYVCIDWDMRVEGPAGNVGAQFGPFMGITAFDDDAIQLGTLGSLGVDATTGDVLYQAADSGVLTETGSVVNFGAWNHYGIELNYFTKTYRFMLNNVQLTAPIGFVDENNVPGGLPRFTDADITAVVAAPGALAAQTGTAYFDNFKVEDGPCPVPEPSTIALAAIGISGLGVARSSSRRRLAS
jgi:hypothetical protein